MRSGDEHDDEHRRADQRGSSEIDFHYDQKQERGNDRKWNDEALEQSAALFFTSRKPGGQKKNGGDLGDFRRLKSDRTESDPAARAVDPHSQMGNETKREHSDGESEPEPPGPLPEMIIKERAEGTDPESHAQPDDLAFNEKINVAVAVPRERARAEKHHDPDDQHAENSQKQKVSALAMHLSCVAEAVALAQTAAAGNATSLANSLVCLLRFGWFRRDDQLLSDLQFVRIIDVVRRH